ncbi:MAG: ThuA domain-containing protein [Pirellulaceae bacterium]
MNRRKPCSTTRISILLVTAVSVVSMLGAGAPRCIAAEPLKIHILSGSGEYKSEASLKAFLSVLEKHVDTTVTASWVKDGAKDLPGIKHLPEADLLIVFARRMKLPTEQMQVVRRHWESGKPVIGIRTASHAFGNEDNEVFDRRVLGGNYQGHFGADPVVVRAAEKANEHPVLEGVGPIVSRKLYKAGPLAEGAVVLQTGTIEAKDATHPVTWVHQYKGGRMFYTSLGVPEDFENEHFRQMLVNAVRWTTKREAVKPHRRQ